MFILEFVIVSSCSIEPFCFSMEMITDDRFSHIHRTITNVTVNIDQKSAEKRNRFVSFDDCRKRYSHSHTNINYFHFNMRQKDLLFLWVLMFFFSCVFVCRHISSNSSMPFFQSVRFCYFYYSACVNTVILLFLCPLSLAIDSIQIKLHFELVFVYAFFGADFFFFTRVFEKSDNLRLMIIIIKRTYCDALYIFTT